MIEVKNLTKKYGNNLAVDNISFTVEPGKVYGFLGPNGAGKSTTMNIITGCLAATSGQVLVNGHDIVEEPTLAKKCIGYLPEQPPLYMDMTPMEYLTFVGKAKGVARHALDEQVAEVIKITGLDSVFNRLIKQLSKGYKQRVGIAQALLGQPDIIILDEPTVGLDPAQIIEIRELIARLGKNHTVILSSHILPEVRAVCSHLMIIAGGKLVANDTPNAIEQQYGNTTNLQMTLLCDEQTARAVADSVPQITEFATRQGENGQLYVQYKAAGKLDFRKEVFDACVAQNAPILAMSLQHVSLEDVFLKLTRRAQKEKEGEQEA